MTETWCVATESGQRYVLDHAGNYGWGPVNVWDNGPLVPIVYRHRHTTQKHCGTCADPGTANLYLPMITWTTPDADYGAEPGSGHPDRGTFVATFSGGPDHPLQSFTARVSRKDWWHHWRDHNVVTLTPHGDWRGEFDRWRTHTTGYHARLASTA